VFLWLLFEQPSEAVELPAVESLVPALITVPRVTVLVSTNPAQVTDGYTTNLVVDAPKRTAGGRIDPTPVRFRWVGRWVEFPADSRG
jgi:hypothetical protein